MKSVQARRKRVKIRVRKRVYGTGDKPRLSVFKSLKHTYAQVILDTTGETLVSASTLDKEFSKYVEQASKQVENSSTQSKKSIVAARAVGLLLAARGKEKKVSAVIFDRNGYRYCGRVSAVADGARAGGFEF